MWQLLKNKKGSVLVIAYFVVLTLAGLSAALFLRTIADSRYVQDSQASLQALYEAEAGIAYAYVEIESRNFHWFTHDSDGITADPHPCTFGDMSSGDYLVAGRNFALKAYPEEIDGVNTGVTVIRCRGTAGRATRIIEYRLSSGSAYQHAFFYSTSHTFGNETFNCHNYGGIHVNGDINFTGYPSFKFLTHLTSGPTYSGGNNGYIYRPYYYAYNNLSTDADKTYANSIGNPQDLPWNMLYNNNSHFSTGYTYFTTGADDADPQTPLNNYTLYYYLDGSGSEWNFHKYANDTFNPGASGASHHWELISFTADGHVDATNLRNLAINELCHPEDTNTLLSSDPPAMGGFSEQQVFTWLYTIEDNPSMLQTLFGTTDSQVIWDAFWGTWAANHSGDFISEGQSNPEWGQWERRFYVAAYNWDLYQGQTIPNGVNPEWWQDLYYGSDYQDHQDNLFPAQTYNDATGEPYERYYLNTKEQSDAWGNWLMAHFLNKEETNKTLVQDASQGGDWVNTGNIFGDQYAGNESPLLAKAKEEGLYIGPDDNYAGLPAGCYEVSKFYNVVNPALDASGKYIPTNVLVIDVKLLKDKIASGDLSVDNGIIYVDLQNFNWQGQPNNLNASGVMLVNGEALPQGGISIVTPNNVFIKGNYNVDPTGSAERSRQADDAQIINHVVASTHKTIDGATYNISAADLHWQPADIITKRFVYTLSEEFHEPQYMPMTDINYYQYYEERDHVTGQSFVKDDPTFPRREESESGNWVPTVSETLSRAPDSRLSRFMQAVQNGQVCAKDGTPIALPEPPDGLWNVSWVDTNLPTNTVFNVNGEFILSNDLRSAISGDITNRYHQRFSYSAVHGEDGTINPLAPSKSNYVHNAHVFNTAIVSPYQTSPYVLEHWGYWSGGNWVNTDRVMNGAFIQLLSGLNEGQEGMMPTESKYADQVPYKLGEYFNRFYPPKSTFYYETRFGRGSQAQDRPPSGLSMGADVSWREVSTF
jgi:hypothetical protein